MSRLHLSLTVRKSRLPPNCITEFLFAQIQLTLVQVIRSVRLILEQGHKPAALFHRTLLCVERFATPEAKTATIEAWLQQRFPGESTYYFCLWLLTVAELETTGSVFKSHSRRKSNISILDCEGKAFSSESSSMETWHLPISSNIFFGFAGFSSHGNTCWRSCSDKSSQ